MDSLKKLTLLEKRKLQQKIYKLSQVKGRHSSLTTLYIPEDKKLSDVTNFLKQEYETASNIKDKTNRKMVQDNLLRLLGELQRLKKIPKNGLAMFYGHEEIGEGQFREIKEIIVPPIPIKQFVYLCGKEFYLDPLKEMLVPKNIIGVVLMEAGNYTIAIIRGKHIEIIKDEDYYIIGKTRKGGQSARRFERLREEQVNNFYKHLAKEINEIFLPQLENIDAIVFGGNSIRVQEFLERGLLDYRLREKIVTKTIVVPMVGPDGVFQALKEISELVRDSEIAREKRLWEDFKARVAKDDNLVTYGKEEILKNLKEGRVDIILISEKLDSFIDEISDLAEQYRTSIEVFSSETESGQELLAFGGVVAILRW